jgi:hypothetical protein
MFDDGSEIKQSAFMDRCMIIWLQATDVLGFRPVTTLAIMSGLVTILSVVAIEQ